jgi:hypothetical protein
MIEIMETAFRQINTQTPVYAAATPPVTPKVVRVSHNHSQPQFGRSARPPVPAAKPVSASNPPPSLLSRKVVNPSSQTATATVMPSQKSWGIQVGAYTHPQEAEQAVQYAMQLIQQEAMGGKVAITNTAAQTGAPLHRARLANLEEQQARRACEKLIALRQSCFVIRAE